MTPHSSSATICWVTILPLLCVLASALTILGGPVVDTLFTSPLALPANPYHHLVKGYKPVRDSISDPVADCLPWRKIRAAAR